MSDLLKAAEDAFKFLSPDRFYKGEMECEEYAIRKALCEAIAAYKEAESKPVAWMLLHPSGRKTLFEENGEGAEAFSGWWHGGIEPLYTHPSPRRLTEDDMKEINDLHGYMLKDQFNTVEMASLCNTIADALVRK